MRLGDNTLIPLYDNEDSVCGILYNNVPYYLIKNLRGDVIAIVDKDARTVARYAYDAWGVCTVTQDSVGIATINPFRYRSYYYDEEIEKYYLQSRYYDSTISKFINADAIIGGSNNTSGYSLFLYCCSEPINRYDDNGRCWKKVKNAVSKFVRGLDSFISKLGVNTTVVGANLLDMEKNGQTYHAKVDCWQQYFGYNDFYDFMFWLGTDMDKRKFPFKYRNKEYIIWIWKGDYINLGAGAEMGIYYGGEPHWKVDKKLAMAMTLKVCYKGKTIISYSKKTWWITGFNPSYMNKKVSDLKVYYTINFSNRSFYSAFKNSEPHGWAFSQSNYSASYSF